MLFFSVVLLFLGFALLILGAITVLSNLNNLARRKRILTTPTSPVRQAMGGRVEIKGHIVPSDEGLVVAPFSGREVVWARVTVTHFKSGGQGGFSESVVLSEVDSRPFFVDDDSGEVARILPQGANIVVDKAVVSQGSRRPPPHIEDFLRARDIKSTDFVGRRKTMSYKEELLAPGDALYALGPSRRDPGPPVSDDTGLAPPSHLVIRRPRSARRADPDEQSGRAAGVASPEGVRPRPYLHGRRCPRLPRRRPCPRRARLSVSAASSACTEIVVSATRLITGTAG